MYKLGQIIENIQINELTYELYGAVRNKGYLLLIENVLQDEIVDVMIYKSNAKISYARPINFKVKSRLRIENIDSNLQKSGAAPLAIMSYQNQLIFKQNIINQLFKRSLNTNNITKIIPSDIEWNYRNKITVFITKSNKNIEFCLKMKNSNNLVPIKTFPLANKILEKVINDLLSLDRVHINYLLNNYESITLRTNTSQTEVMIIFNSNKTDIIDSNFAQVLLSIKPIIAIVLHKNNKLITSINQDYITDQLLGLNFKISSESFYQINTLQITKIYNHISSYIGKLQNTKILDLYCGIGTISLHVAYNGSNVTGVEIIEKAVINANENARLNQIKNCQFICKNTKEIKAKLFNGVSTIILDPPRAGLQYDLIENIIKAKVVNLIYLSCNPHTLVRDLKLLSNNYKIIEVTPYDMFPQTTHIETLVFLRYEN